MTTTDPGVIDAHHHLWDLASNPCYPWLGASPVLTHFGDYTLLRRSYAVDAFLADAAPAGVVKSVHCEAGWNRADPVGETRWLQRVADRRGFPHGIVGFVDLSSDDAAMTLDAHRQHQNFRGVRQTFFTPTELHNRDFRGAERMRSSRWRDGLDLLSGTGISFDLQVVPDVMFEAASVVSRFPDIDFIITHTGLPLDGSHAGWMTWRNGMRRLASCPNAYVKISGLPMLDWQWTSASLRPWVETAIELFSASRCMLGSNFPVDGLHARYGDLMDAYCVPLDDLSSAERRAVRFETARRVYRL